MELVCIQKFGDCEVGDVREVPDDAEFSPMYFARKPAEGEAEPAQLAVATDTAQGEDTGEFSTPVISPPADDENLGASNSDLPENEG
jgi:hypothetical protein